ncbi:hypothetical protein [Streptomyces sp. bgisy091]|uniref:hypothetical protein n=1 Tax=Streptomyces sp. bgisy091 TaxID=3413778 RepID=UPI003D757F81
MANQAGRADGGVRYADELTTELVWEVGDFLLSRLERATRAHPPGSEEHITAAALEDTVVGLVLTLRSAITGRPVGRVRVPDGTPPAPAPCEEVRRVRAETRLERIREDWNDLRDLAARWGSVPGYPGAHWHRIRFRDAAHERWYEERRRHAVPAPEHG